MPEPKPTRHSTAARIRAILDACRDDPAKFHRVVLARDLWHKQIEVCDSVARHPITLVPAGRAVGKSYLLAGLVLWFLYTRRGAQVITTGPDHRQVVTVLWKELRKALRPAHDASGRPVGPRVPLGHHHLTKGMGSPQRLVLEEGSDWGAIGFACSTTEGLSGQHARDLMLIVDEASGVKPEIWEAIWGAAASKYVIVGNPIRYDCHFRELNEKAEAGSPDMRSVRISSLDHPHAALERSPVGAVSRAWLRQMEEIHGSNSTWWHSNIKGCFPGSDDVRFLPVAWVDACIDPRALDDEMWLDYPPGSPRMAVDVGGGVGADRSVVLVRDARRILEIFAGEWHGVLDDARHRLEPVVIDLARKWGVEGSSITYDKNGIGRSFGSYLANHGLEGAVGYFGAGKGGPLYVNRRTANAFAIRRRIDPHRENHVPFYCGGIPEWPALRQELAELRTPAMEFEEGRVKQVLEPKEALQARLHRSPDLLDALLMSFTFTD